MDPCKADIYIKVLQRITLIHVTPVHSWSILTSPKHLPLEKFAITCIQVNTTHRYMTGEKHSSLFLGKG